jgi:hypothetical protein
MSASEIVVELLKNAAKPLTFAQLKKYARLDAAALKTVLDAAVSHGIYLNGPNIGGRNTLGPSGAERLLGKGDLFFLSIGDPVRLQAPYLPPAERARIFGQNSEASDDGSLSAI